MENNKNKKSLKFQGDMFNFCDFIQVFVFTTNHHLKAAHSRGLVSLCYMNSNGTQTVNLRKEEPAQYVSSLFAMTLNNEKQKNK